MSIVIREKDDGVSWEQLTELLHNAYSDWQSAGLNYAAATQSAEATRRRAEPENAVKYTTLVAFDAERPVGTVSYGIFKGERWYHGEKYLLFYQFGVLREYQKSGIGSRLLSAVEAAAEREQAACVVMDTAQNAHSLVEWYHKKGYRDVNFISMPNTDYYSLVFAKPLSPDFPSEKECARRFEQAKKRCRRKLRANGKPTLLLRAYSLPHRLSRRAQRFLFACVRFFKKALTGKRDILIVSSAKQMEEHAFDFYETVKSLPNIRLHICCMDYQSAEVEEFAKKHGLHFVPNIRALRLLPFDLAACTDYFFDKGTLLRKRLPPVIYLNHGFHTVGRKNSAETYAYSQLAAFNDFAAMLEPNRRICETIKATKPKLADRVYHVGWKFAEQQQTELAKYDYYRERLGFKKEDTVVFAVSTWGENSLFQVLGREFFEAAQRLEGNGYHFALSAHPKEYTVYAEAVEPVGALVDEQEKHGMTVRRVGEPWLPYLAAADIVLSDFSTLTETAIQAKKKLILSAFPREAVWKESVMARAAERLPVISSAAQLEQALNRVKTAEPSQELDALAQETYITRAEYEKRVCEIVEKLLNAREGD